MNAVQKAVLFEEEVLPAVWLNASYGETTFERAKWVGCTGPDGKFWAAPLAMFTFRPH